MLLLLANGIALSGLSWILWRIFRQFIVGSPLDNIPGPSAKSWLSGTFPEVYNAQAWDFHREIAEKYGGVIKIKALFGENQLYIFDPKAMHQILVKDQHIFEETTAFIEVNKLILGPGLLSTLGDQHRKQRKMLNPVFSIAHMREMIPTFYSVTYRLRDAFAKKVENGPQEFNVLLWMTRAALELIGQSGLGYSFEPLTENGEEHIFSKSVKEIVPLAFKTAFLQMYMAPLIKIGTPKFRRFILGLIPWKTLHEIRDITDVIHNTSIEIINSKKRALEDGDEAVAKQMGRGKDILSILMRANLDASEEDKFTEEELIGQVSTLTFTAMDTTSGALGRILYLLSIHQDVQNKLRQEITEARKSGGDLSYDELVALPYLEAICRETLRVYPPLSISSRTTRKDTVLPLSTPIIGLDGREMNEILIPNNTNVIIGIYAANRNPEIWGPDACEWKPERWLNPLPETATSTRFPGIYSNLMSFLGGGRACIGFKFSLLEMKVVLFLLIESFRFSPSGKEVVWNMTGLATPTVPSSGSSSPQLPLVVEKVA